MMTRMELVNMLIYARHEYIFFFRAKSPELTVYWGEVCLDVRTKLNKMDNQK